MSGWKYTAMYPSPPGRTIPVVVTYLPVADYVPYGEEVAWEVQQIYLNHSGEYQV